MNVISIQIKFSCRLWPVAILLLAANLAGSAVFAHEGATGVVKQRMDTMKRLGKKMKTLKPLVQNAYDFDAERVASLAQEIQAISDQVEPGFPEGSNQHPSEALPVIWEDWDRFTDLILQMRVASARLGEIATDGDQRSAWQQFKVLGKTCRSCHTDFREEK